MTIDRCFGLYHETFQIREDGETFFSHRGAQGPLDRLTRFSAVGENAAHGQCHTVKTEPDSALCRPPRSPLHVVPGADEEAPRRWQAVRPLHLPEVRLSAHNQAWSETTQPYALAGCGKPFQHSRTSMVRTSETRPVCLVHLVSLMQPNHPDRPNRPNEQDGLAGFFSILLARSGYRRE